MRDTEEYKYEWWLAGMRPLTDDKKRALVEHWGSAREVYNGIYYIEERQKKQLHFLKAEEIDRLQNWARTQDVEELYEQGQRLGVRLVTWFDEAYPKRLKNLIKMPYGISRKGKATGGRQTDSSHRGCQEMYALWGRIVDHPCRESGACRSAGDQRYGKRGRQYLATCSH